MSTAEPSRPRRRSTRRSQWPRVAAAIVAFLVVFAVGIALGKALEDGPTPATTQTAVRTLEPLPQEPG